MRSLQRRKQDIWICDATTTDADLQGVTRYSKPQKHRVTVSNTSSSPSEISAGITPEYSRYFISYDRNFNPKEGQVLFVDKEPLLTYNGNLAMNIDGVPYTKPDYVLSQVMNTGKGTIARYVIRKIAGDAT